MKYKMVMPTLLRYFTQMEKVKINLVNKYKTVKFMNGKMQM
jgi:hypothetical protein